MVSISRRILIWRYFTWCLQTRFIKGCFFYLLKSSLGANKFMRAKFKCTVIQRHLRFPPPALHCKAFLSNFLVDPIGLIQDYASIIVIGTKYCRSLCDVVSCSEISQFLVPTRDVLRSNSVIDTIHIYNLYTQYHCIPQVNKWVSALPEQCRLRLLQKSALLCCTWVHEICKRKWRCITVISKARWSMYSLA
jgi:hypothetical protein